MPEPSLHEWAGGSAAFRRLIDAFYDRVERDPLLSPFFPGGVSEGHRRNVTQWWVEVFGGPDEYTREHGGYANMLAHHRNLGITEEQRLRFATLMSMAADDAELPQIPSSGRRSSAIWSGARGSPWRTPSGARTRRARRRCRTGAGASHRHISPERNTGWA